MILFAGSTFPLEAQFILYNQVPQYVKVIMKFYQTNIFIVVYALVSPK